MQWRPASNTNFFKITTVWVLPRGVEEERLLSCFLLLCYRTLRARIVKERKVMCFKYLFNGAKQFRVCFLNFLKMNTDVYANFQWKKDQVHSPVLVQRGLEKLEERETNRKSVCQRVKHVHRCMPALWGTIQQYSEHLYPVSLRAEMPEELWGRTGSAAPGQEAPVPLWQAQNPALSLRAFSVRIVQIITVWIRWL